MQEYCKLCWRTIGLLLLNRVVREVVREATSSFEIEHWVKAVQRVVVVEVRGSLRGLRGLDHLIYPWYVLTAWTGPKCLHMSASGAVKGLIESLMTTDLNPAGRKARPSSASIPQSYGVLYR